MREIEPARSSKQGACEHNPAGSPQNIQSPPYQTPDDDSANNVAEDGNAGVVSAVAIVGRYTGGTGRRFTGFGCPVKGLGSGFAAKHRCRLFGFRDRCKSGAWP